MRISTIRTAIVFAGCLLTIATPRSAARARDLAAGREADARTRNRADSAQSSARPRDESPKPLPPTSASARPARRCCRRCTAPRSICARPTIRSETPRISIRDFIPRITGTLHGASANAAQSFSTSTTNNYLGGVAVQQYLFDFGRVRGLIEQRDEEAHAASSQSQLTELGSHLRSSSTLFRIAGRRPEGKGLSESDRAALRATPCRAGKGQRQSHSSDRCAHGAGRAGARKDRSPRGLR